MEKLFRQKKILLKYWQEKSEEREFQVDAIDARNDLNMRSNATNFVIQKVVRIDKLPKF